MKKRDNFWRGWLLIVMTGNMLLTTLWLALGITPQQEFASVYALVFTLAIYLALKPRND